MPTLITKGLQSLVGAVRKASRNSLSSYVINSMPEYGQPMPQQGDALGLITPERMREICMKVPTLAASVNAIMDFADGVPITVRSLDAAKKPATSKMTTVQNFLRKPNTRDTRRHFFHKLKYDLTTLGMAAIEIDRDSFGRVANLWPMDMAKVRIDFDEHGKVLGYDQLDAHGMPVKGPDGVHGWEPEDVILFLRDPVTNSVYGNSRIQMLFTTAVLESLMLQFISLRFTDSNIPVGVYDIGDVSEEELQFAIDSWNSQALKQHRILLTGSRGSKWSPFGYHLKDLEATALLAEIRGKQMSVLGVTMNELGESQDINKSNGYNLSYTFKKRAVEPVMEEITQTLTKRLIWEELKFDDMELSYEEIDSRDELIQAEIDKSYIQTGTYTFNHVRNRKGIPSVDGGDQSVVFTGSAYIPVEYIDRFAAAQLEALESVVTAEENGTSNDVSPPLTRAPQSPMRFTTPDGTGSSTTKIRYPMPKKEGGGKSRGNVQTMRNQGLRKEDAK